MTIRGDLHKTLFNQPEDCKRESVFLKVRYPDHQPIYVRYKGVISRHIVPLDQKYSFLVFLVRKSRGVPPTVATMSLMETPRGKHVVPGGATTIGELVGKYAHEDGFMYVDFVNENVFG